jgi:hypothetical protein
MTSFFPTTFGKSSRRRRQLPFKLSQVCDHASPSKVSDEIETDIPADTTLPAQVDYFHSLVPLDLSHQKNAATFGYPSWVYKAQSSKDGNFYALRRLEGMVDMSTRKFGL